MIFKMLAMSIVVSMFIWIMVIVAKGIEPREIYHEEIENIIALPEGFSDFS